MINWGILGCGKIAEKFANDLHLTEGGRLYAVASRNAIKANAFADENHSLNSYGSYEELVTDPEIDIIYIATPHSLHHEHTLLCLKHKKAVLCEKAFAMNLNQVEEMISFAKAQQTFLMEALWTKFLPHFQFVENKINSGELGTIQSLSADFGIAMDFDSKSRLFNKNLGGGSLLDVGIYPVFAALSFLGYTEDITAKAIFGPTKVDHKCSIDMKYANGATASLFSALDEKTDTTCMIKLEKGEIIIHSRFHEPSAVSITQNEKVSRFEFSVPKDVHGYHFEIMHCQEMLHQGKTESSMMNFETSLKLIKMLDVIRNKIGLSYYS